MAMELTLYSDYACPYCYVGQERAARLVADYGLRLRWQPYQLHPRLPDAGWPWPYPEMQRAALEQNVAALAAEAGLPFRWPPRMSSSSLALEATLYAQEQGRFEPFHHALFAAYFVAGRNLADAELLVALGREAGLGGEELRAALAERRYAPAVAESRAEAQERGITSVPVFLIGGRPVFGVQPYDTFQKIVAQVQRRLELRTQPPPIAV